MLNFEQVGARLRLERLRLDINQTKFAEIGGASISTQTRYESGAAKPKIEYLEKLAEHGVDIVYVLTGRRGDGDLGFEESQLLQMFEKLTAGQREAVIRLLMEFSGMTVEFSAMRPSDRTLPTAAVHAEKTAFRGENDE